MRHASLHTAPEHPLLQHFDAHHHAHHPENVQDVAEHFDAFANKISELLPPGHFCDEALHELLDAKDDAIRSLLHKQ